MELSGLSRAVKGAGLTLDGFKKSSKIDKAVETTLGVGATVAKDAKYGEKASKFGRVVKGLKTVGKYGSAGLSIGGLAYKAGKFVFSGGKKAVKAAYKGGKALLGGASGLTKTLSMAAIVATIVKIGQSLQHQDGKNIQPANVSNNTQNRATGKVSSAANQASVAGSSANQPATGTAVDTNINTGYAPAQQGTGSASKDQYLQTAHANLGQVVNENQKQMQQAKQTTNQKDNEPQLD